MNFVANGSEPLAPPFTDMDTGSRRVRNTEQIPIVVHMKDNVLMNDDRIHIYLEPPSGSRGDIYVLEHVGTNESRPQHLYIRENNNFEQLGELIAFLDNKLYQLKDADEGEIHMHSLPSDPFSAFVSEIEEKTSDSLEHYIRGILLSIRQGEQVDIPNALTDEIIEQILAYSSDFHVALTDQDTNSNPLANYELLEFIGDLAAWKPMSDIFLEYAQEHEIEMTEQVMTAMHRSFASKDKQSRIAQRLRLDVYLKKKEEITIDTYEDIFESFVGAFYFVSFKIRALLTVDLQLHERFLRWVYRGWDLSTYEIKPEITKFYEYMRILAGRSAFREREITGRWFMRSERGIQELINTRLEKAIGESAATTVKELFQLIDKSYPKDRAYEERTKKYKDINEFIERKISTGTINRMSNERNMEDWDEDIREQITELVDITTCTIVQRFIDKSRSNYYWIVEDADKNTIYSTMDYDDTEDPSTLLVLILAEEEGIELKPNTHTERTPYDPNDPKQGHYLETKDGKRWFLKGPSSAIEDEIMRVYEEDAGRFFLVVNGVSDTVLEYDAKQSLYIKDSQQFKSIGQSMTSEAPHGHSPHIVRYIGDRAAYGFTALIATLQHHITNVHHLTEVRNFYRSKLLKRYLSKLLGVTDQNGKLLEFDYLIGSNMKIAERIVMHIYSHILIRPRTIFRSESRIKALRMSLYARADAKAVNAARMQLLRAQVTEPVQHRLTDRERTIRDREYAHKSSIRASDGRYIYETSDGLCLSVSTIGLNNERVRSIFADYILDREKQINPNHNLVRNYRFASLPGFDALRQAMDFRTVSEWQLFRNKRGSMELRYFTKGDNEVVYVPGGDIEGIVRHL